ncbi:MAG: sigma-54-dependent Fis family transcriptional regulator [Kiritimatiellae bacterium]|nr:sigma-54-dependent Fis family transcriptional regulator [Kiritimatiellia bacterium]
MSRILVVDDEPRILSLMHCLLKNEGLEVVSEHDGAAAIERIRSESFDLILTDIRMAPVDGMQVFRVARAERPDTPVVFLTAYGAISTAIEAMKGGAFDYLTKPFKVDELLVTIRRALKYRSLVTERDQLRQQLSASYAFDNMVAQSRAMRSVCEMIKRVAPSDATVLISGESGCGKEVVARTIHGSSRRKDKPFIAVNCAAIPETLLESEMFGHVKGAFTGATSDHDGLFAAADGGTLFLDEISALPLPLQGKFLRALQDKEIRRVGGTESIPVDVRVLAASNVSLEKLVGEKAFRQDLYYRLAVITVDIPPLRERREDILPLAQHFIAKELGDPEHKVKISREALDLLCGYDWPGNVRELENAIKHALAFMENDELTPDVLPNRIVSQSHPVKIDTSAETSEAEKYRNQSLRAFLRVKEKEYLKQVLDSVGGDKEKAAAMLKISLATLYRKLEEE